METASLFPTGLCVCREGGDRPPSLVWSAHPPPQSKLLTIIAMLRRPDGATVADLVDATGWKPNSVRGAISGTIKKRRLMKVMSEVVNGVRTQPGRQTAAERTFWSLLARSPRKARKCRANSKA